MNVICEKCNFFGKIDDSKIPEGGTTITCPKCKNRICVTKKSEKTEILNPKTEVMNTDIKSEKDEIESKLFPCPKCGSQQPKGDSCLECGIYFEKFKKSQRAIRNGEKILASKQMQHCAKCKKCGHEVKGGVNFCPNCGEKMPAVLQPKGKNTGSAFGCLMTIVIFFGLITMCSVIPTKPTKTKVENSGWDGSVYQVESYIKKNAKDPSSVEFMEWSPLVKNGESQMVRVKYRAKNSFGAYVINNETYTIDSNGNVRE